ncbi:MAG: acyltransferase [Syntrophobacteraceae bacterium]
MMNAMPDIVRGLLSLAILTVNTIFWSLQLFALALVKAVSSNSSRRIFWDRLMHSVAQHWVGCNNLGLQLTKDVQWDAQGTDGLQANRWYLVIANHQSWADIVVLQKAFHRKVPMLKFFLKNELVWVPVLGIVWKVLEFPFLKRTSSAQKDLEATRTACEKFKSMPVSVMNFVEGTRFTDEKRRQQNSPFKHLLKPKAVGIGLVLDALGDRIHSVLDVTIVYPEGVKQIWEFLCCRSITIQVRVRQIPVTGELLGDYLKDRQFRKRFNGWLDHVWNEKDELIETL